MKYHYEDIKSRIAEPPTWFDENGVPRYGTFSPRDCPNIYADQVALLEVGCQACALRFRVQLSSCQYTHPKPPLNKQIWDLVIHYGDPPDHDCVGVTMNSVPLRVLEFWERQPPFGFERDYSLEVDIPSDRDKEKEIGR